MKIHSGSLHRRAESSAAACSRPLGLPRPAHSRALATGGLITKTGTDVFLPFLAQCVSHFSYCGVNIRCRDHGHMIAWHTPHRYL
jgi:hypothetical protein